MTVLTAAAALAVGLVLLAAALGHLRDARGTRAALAAHDVLPPGMQRAVAVLLAPVELLLGGALLLGAGLLLGAAAQAAEGPGRSGSTLLSVAGGAAVLLLAGFTAYLALVLRRTRGSGQVPCGCGLGTTPVGHWAVLRAALLLALALLATVSATAGVLGGVGSGSAPGWAELPTDEASALAQVFVAAAAGLTLAVATAVLPAARSVPAALTTLPTGGGAR